MKEIHIGIRINSTEGISFFGIEEINNLLLQGMKILEISPGGIIMEELENNDDNDESIALGGFSLLVKLEKKAV